MSTLVKMLLNIRKELTILESIVSNDTANRLDHKLSYKSIVIYEARMIKSRSSFKYRVCRHCRVNLPSRQFSEIDLKKGPGKSVCCRCVKKIFTIHSI